VAQIASYMSTMYQMENAACFTDIEAVKAQAIQQGTYGSGTMAVNMAKVKLAHVQHFINISLSTVQTIKQTVAIDKQAIASLFNDYLAQDLSAALSLFPDGAHHFIDDTGLKAAIVNAYSLAIAQLNAM